MNRNSKANRSNAGSKPIKVFTDGAGARPDGTGSGFAWIHADTGEKHIERVDKLTNNEAEYRGMLSALKSLPTGATAHVFTDSTLLSGQFNGQFKVSNSNLARLLAEVRSVVRDKKLTVAVSWIPRQENLAGRLL